MAAMDTQNDRRAAWPGRIAGAVIAITVAYLLAAAIGGAIPRNAGWREPAEGVTIYVASNGVHTGLLLPARGGGNDWSDLVRPGHLADPRYAGAHYWFGWGERQFYLETPTWGDVRFSTVARAIAGSDEAAWLTRFCTSTAAMASG